MNDDLNCISVFQFIEDHIEQLDFNKSESDQLMTLHEPCKTAYTKVDTSHRNILEAISEITLIEMASGITCCGSWGGKTPEFQEKSGTSITEKRLEEACKTGADCLVTVCHYCQELFEGENKNSSLEVINLIDLIHDRIEV